MEYYSTKEILGRLITQTGHALSVDAFYPDETKIGLEEEALLNYKILSDRSVFKNDLKTFYSRYFWLLIFVEKQKALHGPDMGLEQQLFKLLEESETLSEELDWSIVENLDKKVRRQALHQSKQLYLLRIVEYQSMFNDAGLGMKTILQLCCTGQVTSTRKEYSLPIEADVVLSSLRPNVENLTDQAT